MHLSSQSQIKIFTTLVFFCFAACGSETTSENSGTFEALTYNVAGLPLGISQSDPVANIPAISPLLNGYDLVLVQEDFVYHKDLKRHTEHPYQSEPKDPVGRIIADGLNRFSNFPFETLIREQWGGCYGDAENGHITGAADCLAEKGFSLARTTLASGIVVDVYNHHGEAGGAEEDAIVRSDGFAQLTEFMRTHSEGHAIVMGGDTNLGGNDVVFLTFLEENNLIDACTFLDCGIDSIDRFLFRNNDEVTLTPVSWRFGDEFVDEAGGPLSDHHAVHVSFRWERVQAE